MDFKNQNDYTWVDTYFGARGRGLWIAPVALVIFLYAGTFLGKGLNRRCILR